jgi:hypothetical protein
VPAGRPDGGQWTRVGVGAPSGGREVASDAAPDNEWKPGALYATRRGGRGGPPPMEPGQAARLSLARAKAHDAIARVRELDPNWRRTTTVENIDQAVEGQIRAYEAEAREAEARIAALAQVGIGPGPFAAESLPARGPGRDFTIRERAEIDRIGYGRGCHTCGTRDPGTIWGHFIPDHQLPTALNRLNRPQRLYPQCVGCSRNQGLWIIHK